jgi:hypothetical protein
MGVAMRAIALLLLVPGLAAAQSGGPDPFGYTYGPVALDWVPLAAEPTATAWGVGDDWEVEVTLPWTFPFYDSDLTFAVAGSNGGLIFGEDDIDFGNACIPSSASGSPDIAVFWDDLDPSSGGDLYSWHDPVADRVIVSWEDVPHFGGTNPASFQVHLWSDGTIDMHWLDVEFGDNNDFGGSATIGIQNAVGNGFLFGEFLQLSCDTASLANNTATRFEACFENDGDGFDTCSGDCDDYDATSFPGGTEVCDGTDNDCSGSADFDLAGEVDADGDGSLSCAECDDADPAVYPGAPEVCDGVDQDCDGFADSSTQDISGVGSIPIDSTSTSACTSSTPGSRTWTSP